MRETTVKPVKEIVSLDFKYLPAFAEFLLKNKVREFVLATIENSKIVGVPLLKFFDSMPREEMVRMSIESNTKMLTLLSENRAVEYIQNSRETWIRNQLPVISREQIILEDITLVNFVRRQTFRDFMKEYTSSAELIRHVMEDLDKFSVVLDSNLFEGFILLQQEKLQTANDALRKNERQLQQAQAMTQLGSFEWDFTGNNNSTYSPEVYKIFEFDKTSSLENFLHDVHADDRERVIQSVKDAMVTGDYECEYRYIRNHKSKIIWSRGVVFFEDGKPSRMTGTIMDVTEKHQIINRLKENEELSKQAQALTHTGSWTWLSDKNEILWSDQMYRIYGLAPQSENITFEQFINFIHPDDRQRRIAEINHAMATGKASDYIMKIITQEGVEKVLRGKGEVLIGRNNKATGMLGTCQDITHEYQLTRELEQKNEELVRKNKDLESFNFIASHDLQEPLRKIQIYGNRILNEGFDDLPANLRGYFEKITTASNRMQMMIEDFLTFYKSLNSNADFEPVDFHKILHEVTAELSFNIEEKKALLEWNSIPSIRGIPPNLKQMLKHLIANALKYSKHNQRPEIRIESAIEESTNGTKSLRISVIDNGIGFEEQYALRIFELFQRLHTKDEYTGSGIGLALAKKIAEDHGGRITATSKPGKGSTFSVYLPI